MEYQGTPLRAVAAIIDLILLMIPSCVLGFVIAVATDSTTDDGFQLEGAPALLLFLLMFLLWFGYYTLFEAAAGATPGKLAVGLRVVRLDGRRPGLQAALIRNVLRIVDALFFYLVAVVAVESSPYKQRLGDRVAGTSVVKRAALASTEHAGTALAGER
jgi:uncharacterized RDD family membrane protein YckC